MINAESLYRSTFFGVDDILSTAKPVVGGFIDSSVVFLQHVGDSLVDVAILHLRQTLFLNPDAPRDRSLQGRYGESPEQASIKSKPAHL